MALAAVVAVLVRRHEDTHACTTTRINMFSNATGAEDRGWPYKRYKPRRCYHKHSQATRQPSAMQSERTKTLQSQTQKCSATCVRTAHAAGAQRDNTDIARVRHVPHSGQSFLKRVILPLSSTL